MMQRRYDFDTGRHHHLIYEARAKETVGASPATWVLSIAQSLGMAAREAREAFSPPLPPPVGGLVLLPAAIIDALPLLLNPPVGFHPRRRAGAGYVGPGRGPMAH